MGSARGAGRPGRPGSEPGSRQPPSTRTVTLVLAGVVALQSADGGVVGASAVPLRAAFGVPNAQIGLLLTVTTAVGALAALPAGVLIDRVSRVTLLAVAVAAWSAASALGGLAGSFTMLLLTRAGLGALIALGAPAIASLLGDFFPPAHRARVYSRVLCGQLAGAGIGVVVAGTLAGWSWRAPFLVLALPGAVLAVLVWRLLPEPARGSQGRTVSQTSHADDPAAERGREDGLASAVRRRGAQPRPALVRQDLATLPAIRAIRYVLSVPSTVVLVVGSALAYFFLSGLETFMLEFIRGRFDVGQAAGSVLVLAIGSGGLIGVVAGGLLSDRLIRAGIVSARPVVTGAAFLATTVLMVAALHTSTRPLGLALLAAAATSIGVSVPPLDAARLDVIAPAMWGRAEGVRTLLRSLFQSAAPVVFGLVSDAFGGREGSAADSAGVHQGPSPHHGDALSQTFLVMLIPLAAGGLLLSLIGRRTYSRDVATTLAIEAGNPGIPRPARAAPSRTG